ncbi:MAG TPA: hypothetical protein VHX86_18310 [Tepidisphaeraceae bacterium]|jgi:hypothetical protein|nr:hypothetical protein [Tepidisphaeraceae bacterium]
MEVLKKNLFSIIFGIIAILAVVALYWPMDGLYATLRTELDSRVQVSSSLDALTNASRSMPLLSPDETNPAPLEVFPTQPVIDAGIAATQQVSQQAQKMLDRAVSANQHLPLLPDELPKPTDSNRYLFAQQYARATTDYSRWQQILDSTAPPTPEEVQAAKDKLLEEIDKARLVTDAQGNPTPDSTAEAQEEYGLESASVQPRMELERAQRHQIYLLPNSLPVDTKIKDGTFPMPDEICDAQLVMWVLDDVTQAIAKANELYSDPASPGGPPQHDILHAAVKSIEGIDAPAPVLAQTGVDATAGVNSPAPMDPTVSPTGRVCNGLYDAVRFRVRLVVDAAKVEEVMRQLEVGQFITVLNVQFNEVVDPAAAASATTGGFRYGDKPVVRVEFDCEELLMRKWTDNILPESRKNGLGKGALGNSPENGAQPEYGQPGGPPGGAPGFGVPPRFGGPPGGFGGPPRR